MTVRKSADQQEEYRVRDTESRLPRTEAGRRMLVGLLDYDALPPDRMGWNRDAIRAIEAEAALLTRPTAEPSSLREALQQMIDHDAEQNDNCGDWGTDSCKYREQAVLALLARRAPGDPWTADRLAEVMGRTQPGGCYGASTLKVWAQGILRLAADSRPEQPRQADERDAIAKEVTRDGGRRRVWTNSGDKGATVRDAAPVRPEEPPE